MTNIDEFKERVKTSWGRDSMLLKDLLESRHHLRIYMNKIKQFNKKNSAPFGLTRRISTIERLTETFDAK
jgi:hypothetical protein